MIDFISEKLQEEVWSRLLPLFQWQRIVLLVLAFALAASNSPSQILLALAEAHVGDLYEMLKHALNAILIYQAGLIILFIFWLIPIATALTSSQMTRWFHVKIAQRRLDSIRESNQKLRPDAFEAERIFDREASGVRRVKAWLAMFELWTGLLLLAALELPVTIGGTLLALSAFLLGGFLSSQRMMALYVNKVVPARLLAMKL